MICGGRLLDSHNDNTSDSRCLEGSSVAYVNTLPYMVINMISIHSIYSSVLSVVCVCVVLYDCCSLSSVILYNRLKSSYVILRIVVLGTGGRYISLNFHPGPGLTIQACCAYGSHGMYMGQA